MADQRLDELTEETSPAADDLIYVRKANGDNRKVQFGNLGALTVVSFDFTFATPDLHLGVDTGIVIPEGSVLPVFLSSIIVTEEWDAAVGGGPYLVAAGSQATATDPNADAAILIAEAGGGGSIPTGASQTTDNMFAGNQFNNYTQVVIGGDVHVWVGNTAFDGSGDDPLSTTGAATLTVRYLAPPV